ncbi:LuxR C-terminal-related transcriptional regulator [Phenylobacterium sp. LjRoot219]|uniref:helix-turn-helix transcriptional regulator n=1 Tax=Phenylobacterium sp. LjRoot219 TaxID=3342283 RepID=UPI003ECDBACB
MFNRELANGAFEAAIEAQKAQTLEHLNSALAPAIERLGFRHFVAVDVLGGGEQRRVRILHGEAHRAWEQHYNVCDYAKCDAAIAEIAASTEPFFRSELAKRRGGLTRLDAQIAEEARSFGVRDSLFVPQHHIDGALSSVVFTTTEELDRTPCLRTAAHLLAVHYGLQTRRLLRSHPRRTSGRGAPALSRRQLECLKWVRAGKTSAEIGKILNLSARTVDAYLAAACERLGVRTRAQAMSRAQAEGVLPA